MIELDMSNTLDFNLLPLCRRVGEDQTILPGLLAARRPRRTARGREPDQLILYLAFWGSEPLADEIDAMLVELSRTYYGTPGAVTSALRFTAESLNRMLLELNRKRASGQQIAGLLSLVVLRGEQLFLAQCGPVHAYFLSSRQVEHLYDPQLTGRGLGLSQATPLRYFQAAVQSNDTLLLAAQPAQSWNADTLSTLYGQGPESQRRRLLGQVDADVQAVILQARQGSGKVLLLSGASVAATPALQPDFPASEPQPVVADSTAPQPFPTQAGVQADYALDDFTEDDLPEGFLPLVKQEMLGIPEPPLESRVIAEAPVMKTMTSAPRRSGREEVGVALVGASRRAGRAGKSLLSRILPGEAWASIPNSVLAFVALAVPLIIVAVALAVYFRRGLAAQSEYLYSQAVEVIAQAQAKTDPLKRRESLIIALTYLDQSDSMQKIPGSDELRPAVVQELDRLDLVRRLDYRPAVSGSLGETARITRIVVVDGDLYLLDSSSNRVLRAVLSEQGYQIDATFLCDQGSAPGIGSLVDIAAWPNMSDISASIAAMDADGFMLYCAQDANPQVEALGSPVSGELAKLVGFSLDFNNLFVLDPQGNAVWVYAGGNYTEEPSFYFDVDLPPTLGGMVDLETTR